MFIAIASVASALLGAVPPDPIGTMTVVGNNTARVCYEAAAGDRQPSEENLRTCDSALSGRALAAHDLIATQVNRGIVRMRRGDNGGGIEDFDAAIKLNPNQPEALLNKGIALVRLGAGGDAVDLFTRALSLRTGRPELAHYGRAIANEQAGRITAAYHDYRRASELKPNWSDPRDELRRFRIQARPMQN